MTDIPLVPPSASTAATQIDRLFLFELAVALFFICLIFLTIIYFAIRYRRRSEDEIPAYLGTHYSLEAAWTIVPFLIMCVMFFWGAKVYVELKRPAANALEIHVLGKQWMWKIEHANGVREINALHVPVGRPVKLIMASQDVIHDFFIPAFRIKQDVIPGSYVTEWFQATKIGEYHVFCAQYCGTDHAQMVGKVIVMEPADYQAWLAGAVASEPPAAAGEKLFMFYGCANCHGQRAPTLAGLYGSQVRLEDGSVVIADDQYLRQSILNPTTQIVAGFAPIMPSFQGQVTEEQLAQLIEFIKSLQPTRNEPTATPLPAAPLKTATTRPAPGDQPQVVPNYPPAEHSYQVPLPQGSESR
jgi:cytochrome c oxidase subunit 2